jgi:hypothetical protein
LLERRVKERSSFVRPGKERKVEAVEGRPVNQPKDNGYESPSAWSYRLVLYAVFSVTGAFILVMGLFAYLQVFNENNAANVTAALSSLFGIVGTLVGAYFGIKASSDAQDRSANTAQKAVADQKETAQRVVADQKETAQRTVEKTMATVPQTPQGAGGASPKTMALATLIPAAGGASLIVLWHYLGRK